MFRSRPLAGAVFTLLFALAVAPNAARAADILVPQEIGTIQGAIETAINGDTVLVRLDNIWVIPIGQTIGVLSGGGIRVRYTRSASGWVGEIVGDWVA